MSWTEALEDDEQTLKDRHEQRPPVALHYTQEIAVFAADGQHMLLDSNTETIIIGTSSEVEAYLTEHGIDPYNGWEQGYCHNV